MIEELIKRLLEAGVHFGHQTKRWNPKMKKYIFGARSGIYIIDLEKTVECLSTAKQFIRDITARGGKVLFIGTKKQAQDIVEQEANKNEMHYVKNRWSGGLLTNFQTVKKSLARLNEIERMKEDGTFESLKKKEIAQLTKERERLLFNFGGIRKMNGLPDVVFIIDPKKEEIAVQETTKLNIPIVALVDTNCNPEILDYPIPGNDDALKSIRLITELISESVAEGRREFATSQSLRNQSADAGKKEAAIATDAQTKETGAQSVTAK